MKKVCLSSKSLHSSRVARWDLSNGASVLRRVKWDRETYKNDVLIETGKNSNGPRAMLYGTGKWYYLTSTLSHILLSMCSTFSVNIEFLIIHHIIGCESVDLFLFLRLKWAMYGLHFSDVLEINSLLYRRFERFRTKHLVTVSNNFTDVAKNALRLTEIIWRAIKTFVRIFCFPFLWDHSPSLLNTRCIYILAVKLKEQL